MQPPPPPKRNLKSTGSVDTNLLKAVRNLRFSLNQPLKSADDWYIGILKNVITVYSYVDFFVLQF
jgi:hypothetical protein